MKETNEHKIVVWVTDDCYVDHDVDVVPAMSSEFIVHWIVLFAMKNNRFSEKDFDDYLDRYPNLHIHFIYSKYRKRNVRNIFFYLQILKITKDLTPFVYHMDIGVDGPWAIPLFLMLPHNKTIIVLHQGQPHEGMSNRWLSLILRKIVFFKFKNVKMFSKSQANIFRSLYPNHNIFVFNLPLIGFGQPTNKRTFLGNVRFLCFGTINYTKNIDLVIDAACLLHERGIRGFVVSINGSCKEWSWYQQKIKYPDIFELNIRMIKNEEIPNLFNAAHYLVQPYRVVSQSGPTKIAFRYNLPVLCSDLPGFTDEIKDGVNGFIFKSGNVEALADKMQFLINSHASIYQNLLESQKKYTEENYSEKVFIGQHVKMFNEIV